MPATDIIIGGWLNWVGQIIAALESADNKYPSEPDIEEPLALAKQLKNSLEEALDD